MKILNSNPNRNRDFWSSLLFLIFIMYVGYLADLKYKEQEKMFDRCMYYKDESCDYCPKNSYYFCQYIKNGGAYSYAP